MANAIGSHNLKIRFAAILIMVSLMTTACLAPSDLTPEPDPDTTATSTQLPFTTTNLNIPGWNRLLSYDAIRPVYEPTFISAAEAMEFMEGSELIMGLAWDGQAKAYPVTVLNRREMVNDEMAGVPYLVSW